MIPIAQPDIRDAEYERVKHVLDTGMLADGPEVRAFEDEFAAYCGTDHAIATSNGTTALHAALWALNLGPGDTVVTTPLSFIASANAIRFVGAEPVFGDIDPETYTLDPESVERIARTRDIDAILPVHLYGLPSDLDHLLEIAADNDAVVIEDAAQAHGATYRGTKVGGIGDAGCFSFYPTKNMTTGEGGMITTNDQTLADRIRRFVNHGRTDQYAHASVGHNFRMTSIAAAIGRVQLERLPRQTERRRERANVYDDLLEASGLHLPEVPSWAEHVYHQYTVRSGDRDQLTARLEQHDIGYGIYYPACIHNQPAYDDVSHHAPVAERAVTEVVSLPVHPGVTEEDLTFISDVVKASVPA